MTSSRLILLLLMIGSLLISSGQQAPNIKGVKIGNQEWMAANLDVSKFRNGDPIPEAKTGEEWGKAGDDSKPAWCYYNNDPANGAKYGKLYNWYAVTDPRALSPKGWHIPTVKEWTALTDYLRGGTSFAAGGGLVAGLSMKSTSGWDEEGNANNHSGFAGLPGGTRGEDGEFGSVGEYASWWTSSEYGDEAWSAFLTDNTDISSDAKASGYSIRCVRD